ADNTVIDVMVVYTDDTETAVGSVNDVETMAAAAIASTNTAYTNSGINITLNLVHVAAAGYSDSGDFSTDLNRLTLTNDGFMDNIHTLRTTYGADMVVLLNNSSAYCGLGWLMTDLNAGYSGYMFTVVYHACAVGNLSFAHELGHNMGADHDRDNGSGGLYNYSFGHRFGGSRSVMAYAPGTRVSYFSNPNVSYLGQPTGIAAGDLNSADNTSTLNSSAAMIAGFKSVTTYGISGAISLSGQPLSGVSINGGAIGSTTSNGSGNYSFSGLANGSNYTLTPSRYGYTFTPSSASGTISAANATHNFTATKVNYTLSGRVTISGTGLGGLTINGGALGTTTTNGSGNYSFGSVPYLTAYNISISAPINSTFASTSLSGSTSGNLSNLNFSGNCTAPAYLLSGVCQTDGTSPPTDSDGDGITDSQEIALGLNPAVPDSDSDGVTDGQEITDGTDPLDRGSAHMVLSTTVCGEWNGFLGGMYNILEHVNMSDHRLNISSTLYNLNGESKSNYNFGLNPGAQFDLLVHDLQGRDLNSIGQVCSTHNGNEGDLDGRMIYYKLSSEPGETFDFAFALPFTNSTKGTQFVPFNTYQPSLDPTDAANPVANWIQLTNSGVSYKTGVLTFYDMTGQILNSLSVSIPGGARRDFSGHQFGPSLVGLVKWQPDDNSAPFQLRNIRYIYNNPNWQDNFSAAFQLSGAIGSGRQLFIPLDTASSSAILEVSNTSSLSENVTVNIRSSSGVVLKTITFSLPAYGSRHIVTDEYLNGSYGSADIKGTRKGTLVAVAMQYKRTPTGGISSMYGIKGREAMGSVMKSSYNTYLGQSCKLTALNTKNSNQTLTLNMVGWDGTEILSPADPRATVGLPPYGTTEIDVCAFDSANNYGVVTLQSSTANAIVGSVVRIGANDEYRFPTPLRE
ncbi:MAG: M12 family metallo-peptidase, partial [bacterium]|nr:M12 family metallo-peptidase [bacterium]